MHAHNKGILLMIVTTILFASQDTITKHIGQSIPVFQFVGIRYLAFLLFALWWVTRKYSLKAVLTVKNPWLQASRGAILGIEVVAEGVENHQMAALLHEMHCDLVQGYHYCAPIPAKDFLTMIQNRQCYI